MGFILIKGTFHVKGYSPDGDSIKFKARTTSHWLRVKGEVKRNRKNHAQLRLEAIDTLETHYKRRYQPKKYALGALEFLLKEFGINGVRWNTGVTRITQANDGVKGFILTRQAERYGRPVAFAFVGETALKNGSNVWLDDDLLKKSVNYKLIKEGLAYPTYYDGLFADLRNVLSREAVNVRRSNKGLYPVDKTFRGFPVTGVNSVQKDHVILPKLFRRIVSHLDSGQTIHTFKEALESRPEKVLILSTGHFTHFDNLIEVRGKKVTMLHPIEDVVFL